MLIKLILLCFFFNFDYQKKIKNKKKNDSKDSGLNKMHLNMIRKKNKIQKFILLNNIYIYIFVILKEKNLKKNCLKFTL